MRPGAAGGVRSDPELQNSRRTLETVDGPRPRPEIGAPATRALAEVGVRSLDDAERVDLALLATLHGVGPKAIALLRAALEK